MYVFVNSIERRMLCANSKLNYESYSITQIEQTKSNGWFVHLKPETYMKSQDSSQLKLGKNHHLPTCLPIYISIWHKCLWNYIKMTKVCKFWNWTFWFCHIVIFATLKTHNFFNMICKFNNIIYNAWKKLFNVTSIFLIKLNLISRISITCNLIMYQQKKINLINDEYKRITHEIVCLNMSAMGKANSWGKSKASLKGKWKFMKNVGR